MAAAEEPQASTRLRGKDVKNLQYRGVKIELPYLPHLVDYSSGCQGIKVCGGLFVPCQTHVKNGVFCAPCKRQQESGTADGTVSDREMCAMGEFTSKRTGKHEITFATYLEKRDITFLEFNAFLEGKFGPDFQIPDEPAYIDVDEKKVVISRKTSKLLAAKQEEVQDDVYVITHERRFGCVIYFKCNGVAFARDEEDNVFLLDDEEDPADFAGTWMRESRTIRFESDFDLSRFKAIVKQEPVDDCETTQEPLQSTIPDFVPDEGHIQVNFKNLKLAYDPSTNFLFRYYDDSDENKPFFMTDGKVLVGMWDPDRHMPRTMNNLEPDDDMEVFIKHEGKWYMFTYDEYDLFAIDDNVVDFELLSNDKLELIGAWDHETNTPIFNIHELTQFEYKGVTLHRDKVKNIFNITAHGCKHLVGMWDNKTGEPEFLEDGWEAEIKTISHDGVELYYDTYDHDIYVLRDDAESGILKFVGYWDTEADKPVFDE